MEQNGTTLEWLHGLQPASSERVLSLTGPTLASGADGALRVRAGSLYVADTLSVDSVHLSTSIRGHLHIESLDHAHKASVFLQSTATPVLSVSIWVGAVCSVQCEV